MCQPFHIPQPVRKPSGPDLSFLKHCESADVMSYRRRLKNKKPPEGWGLIEEVIEDFEQQMKEAVNEEHEGKRKAELTWKIHRIHWEKNRFVYDLMYQRKVMSRELVSVASSRRFGWV